MDFFSALIYQKRYVTVLEQILRYQLRGNLVNRLQRRNGFGQLKFIPIRTIQ